MGPSLGVLREQTKLLLATRGKVFTFKTLDKLVARAFHVIPMSERILYREKPQTPR